ncbi:MAG: HigA family addiction module antitoxin [Bdellovibrionales bacterium]
MKHTHYVHPGEILKTDYLEGYGLSVKAAAEAMDIPRTRLNDIVLGRRGISADTALRLARLFGGEAIFWSNLQAHYDLAEAEAKIKADKSFKKIHRISEGRDGAYA